MRTSMKVAMAAAVLMLGLAGCGGGANEHITRVNSDEVIDINSGFNQNDARFLARQQISDAMGRAWITNWQAANGGANPKIVLGNVKNETGDYTINPAMMTDEVQREMLNSGRVRVFAAKDIRQQLRAERFDTEFAEPATVKKAASEIKADFMLLGALRERVQVSGDGRSKVVFYELQLEMTDMATTEKVWFGRGEVQKTSQR